MKEETWELGSGVPSHITVGCCPGEGAGQRGAGSAEKEETWERVEGRGDREQPQHHRQDDEHPCPRRA